MNLYNAYKSMPPCKWKYYDDAPQIDVDNFNKNGAYVFIKGTYKVGYKNKIFDIGFQRQFKDQGKHQHTVALYFLGCYLSEMLSDILKNHIAQYIEKTDWYDFRYTWFLTCLYHDTAAVIEKPKYICKSLDYYLDKHSIKYNIYKHTWKNACNKPYTYLEKLVKNYFIYMAEYRYALDHGIIAGYLLYDRLRKNYNDTWERCKKQQYSYGRYEEFDYENLSWKIEHIDHFAYVANAIISHNIWHSEATEESKRIYKQYGLDPLIYGVSTRMSIKKDPLVFFLGLLDTIEPIKFFISESDAVTIWKAIEIDYDINNRKIIIKTNGSLLKNDEWFQKIRGITAWLNVGVCEYKRSREIIINVR